MAKDFDDYGAAIFTNLIIFTIVYGLGTTSLFVLLPRLMKSAVTNYQELFYGLLGFGDAASLLMWTWSWLTACIGNPGLIREDLKERGFLHQIEQGNVPKCLGHLKICSKCGLPKPRQAHHCKICGGCVLRMDHHCGVIGQCVGDRNFKAFILSFIYGAVLGLFVSVIGITRLVQSKEMDAISLVVAIYCLMLTVMFGAMGFSFFSGGLENIAIIDQMHARSKTVGWMKLYESFGDKWWKRLIPYQKESDRKSVV